MSKLEVDAIEPQSGTTLTLGASGDTVNIASGATITDFTSTGIDDNATSTAITINSSENVGINTSSPETTLHVNGSDRLVSPIRVESVSTNGISLISGRINATEDAFTLGLAYSSASLIIGNRVKPSGSSQSDATGYLSSSDQNKAKCAMKMDTDGDIKFYNAPTSSTAVDSVVAMTERMRIDLDGSVDIYGALSKGSGSFKIDHPLPSKNSTHNLVHSFTESPQADLIYRGKVDLVDGTSEVNVDTISGMTNGTFVLLNTNVQCFTSNESGWTAVKGSVSGNTLTITAQDNTCDDTISWMVVGERHDQHMLDTDWTDENGKVITEPLKKIETTTP